MIHTSVEDLDKSLASTFSWYQPVDSAALAAVSVDGVKPSAYVVPGSIEELACIIKYADDNDLKVIPRGAGSKIHVGRPPVTVDIVVSTERLNKVIEYAPADMTVTVEAGMKMRDLQECLSASNQFLPLDPPYGDVATVGGTLSANESGPIRWSFGTARDLVIGTRVVQANGTVVKGGGKVVKNVAGYDINKIYLGAYGTLGILAEVTLKVMPEPACREALIARFPTVTQTAGAAENLLDSEVAPTFVSVTNPVPLAILSRRSGGGLGDSGYGLVVGGFGSSETVLWQMSETRRLCEDAGALLTVPIKDSLYTLMDELFRELPAGQAVPRGMTLNVVIRVSLPPSDCAGFYDLAENLCQQKDVRLAMLAHYGNGAMILALYGDGEPDETRLEVVAGIAEAMRSAVDDLNGMFNVHRSPLSFKGLVDVWGTPKDEWQIMRRVKDRFDPKQTLNPGRYIKEI